MSNQLCICIPTFNRIDKLRKSLSYHANLCLKYGAGLVVSDNASTDGTRELLIQYKEQYSWFDFVSNHSNIGPDANFNRALKLGLQTEANYMWLLGDDDFIEPDALIEVLNRLDDDTPNFLLVNTKNQVYDHLPFIYTSHSDLLRDLAWHTTFMSSLIFSKSAANFGIESNESSPNFSHVFGIFNYLSTLNSIRISWIQKPSVTTMRLDSSLPSWFPHILDIFVSNWVKTINGLPSIYSLEDKKIAIRSLWRKSKILNYKTIIFMIFRDDIKFLDYLHRKAELYLVIGKLRFYSLFIAFMMPKYLSKRIARIALNRYVKRRAIESRSFNAVEHIE